MAKRELLKKNELITLDIEDLTNLGFGVGRYMGAVVFVASAVPGDRVRARIIKAASSYYVGRAEEYITLSDMRSEGRCDNKRCHSCAYREISYECELEIKRSAIRSAFLKEGVAIEVLPTVPSPKKCGYRNKAQYPIALDKNGDYTIGFYAPKSHNVCEAADCNMAPDIFGDILECLRTFFKENGISVYSEKDGTGLLRHIYLRRSEELGEVMLVIVINGDRLPRSDALVATVTERFSEVCGILLNVNRENTNVILGDRYVTLFGRDYITDTLAGVKLKITAPSFYQVNHGTATLIYEKARELAALSKDDVLLDLFCGAGSIGLSMARDCRELIGIEIVESAVECAKYNALANGITNASFYTGDASDAQKFLERAEVERGEKIVPDVVILDPPRAGSTESLLSFVASLSPKRIVYVSCNPQTLARDVKIMAELGYTTDTVEGYDMFPMTGHVESLVCLQKQIN